MLPAPAPQRPSAAALDSPPDPRRRPLRHQYANATCVDANADAAVVAHGAKCFAKCPQPVDKNTDCWLDCYRNTLMGDPAQNLTAVDPAAIIEPWERAFRENDPAKGGCPHVKPTVGPI